VGAAVAVALVNASLARGPDIFGLATLMARGIAWALASAYLQVAPNWCGGAAAVRTRFAASWRRCAFRYGRGRFLAREALYASNQFLG